jgi:hypothetical protein
LHSLSYADVEDSRLVQHRFGADASLSKSVHLNTSLSCSILPCMSDSRVILDQLRAAIARHQSSPPPGSPAVLATGLVPLDLPLGGGLPRGGIVEMVCPEQRQGATTLATALLRRRAMQDQWTAWIDAGDHFDPQSAGAEALSRLLWLRCKTLREALRAADLLLRDANLPLVLLDLRGIRPAALRREPPGIWYRFQRLLEPAPVGLLVFTLQAAIPCARQRLLLESVFGLDDLFCHPSVLAEACAVAPLNRGSLHAAPTLAGAG